MAVFWHRWKLSANRHEGTEGDILVIAVHHNIIVLKKEVKELTELELQMQKQKDHEDDLRRLRGFRPIDDTFIETARKTPADEVVSGYITRILFRDNLPLAEYVLRTILGKDDLNLMKEETQKDLVRLLGARGLCLDMHSVDADQQQYDVEVQRADKGTKPERARYHAGALDVENLNSSQEFDELPTTYVIFFFFFDVFKAGKALYPIEHINTGTGEVFKDRQHVLYVNASYKGDDAIGRPMYDFLCSDPDKMYTELMAERARYLKSHPEGVEIMCKAMDDMRAEVEQRTKYNTKLEDIKKLMTKLKYTAQQAMDFLDIPVVDQPKYLAKL